MRRHIRLVQGKAQQFDKERADLAEKRERAVRAVARASRSLRQLKGALVVYACQVWCVSRLCEFACRAHVRLFAARHHLEAS